ncbi:MAG: hypothetical protein LBU24_01950 [Methanocalculaceae archaeon]|jgi:hypothetical protein|nr:hypothetical protein [Methanocalculaceae archaeon]
MTVCLTAPIGFGAYEHVEKFPMYFSIYTLALSIIAMIAVNLLTTKLGCSAQ